MDAGLNSSTHGYAPVGRRKSGGSRVQISAVSRIAFPFDSGTAEYTGDLDRETDYATGNNSSINGYVYAGRRDGGGDYYSSINRIQFPFDSGIAQTCAYVENPNGGSSANNSSAYGYTCAGHLCGSSGLPVFSAIERFNFAVDTANSNQVSSLLESKTYVGACDGTDFVSIFN